MVRSLPNMLLKGISGLQAARLKKLYLKHVMYMGCNTLDTHDDFKPNVPLSSRNILEDLELKNAVKAFSHWPTFPQIFIKGQFIGGSDIMLDMHRNGELNEKLKDIRANEEKSA